MSPSLPFGARTRYVRPSHVASICGVATKTVLRWIARGILPAELAPCRRYRIEPRDVAAFCDTHKYPVPRELRELVARVESDDTRPST